MCGCLAVPSPPTGPLEIRCMGGNVVTSAWGTPEWDGGAPLLGYNVAIRDVTKTMWMEVRTNYINTVTYLTFPDHYYLYALCPDIRLAVPRGFTRTVMMKSSLC